jgi:hypothetical protein
MVDPSLVIQNTQMEYASLAEIIRPYVAGVIVYVFLCSATVCSRFGVCHLCSHWSSTLEASGYGMLLSLTSFGRALQTLIRFLNSS